MNEEPSRYEAHQPEPLLIVISGPSGVGKDTVVDHMKVHGLPFHFVITATTRPPRQNETPGVDYFFYTKEQFIEMIEQDELLEYALVYSDYKGVPKSQVREALVSGKDVVMRLDVQGAATIKEMCPEAILIFLMTESEEELFNRLKARKTEDLEELKLRIKTLENELDQIDIFDYIVMNRDSQLDQTVNDIKAIIDAEHLRVDQRKVSL